MVAKFPYKPSTGLMGGKALPLEVHGRAGSVNPRKLPEPGRISAACVKGRHGNNWCTSLACACPCHRAVAKDDGVLVDGDYRRKLTMRDLKPVIVDEAEFKESDHPRRKDGKFGEKGAGGASSSEDIPKPPKNTLQLKRMHQWAQEGNIKSIDKTIDFQNKELEKSEISSEEREWRGQVKEYGEQLRKYLGGSSSSLKTSTPSSEGHPAPKIPASELKPSLGEPVSQDSKGNGVKIERGTPIYHTSQSNLKSLKDQTMWFTPFQDEAEAFNRNIKNDFGHAKTFEMEWDGSPIATKEQAASIAKEIWPDDEFIYSMFDEAVGDRDPEDVRHFIKAMEDHGFAGSMIDDYSAIDQQKNCDSLAVFHPDRHMNISGKAKAKDSLLADGLALLGLYSIWRALSRSRFDMPEGSGARAAKELKAQLGVR